MSKTIGQIRRSQLITTYGIGSVVAVEDLSVMILGQDYWGVSRPDIHEPRLERLLDVKGFISPPASGEQKHKDIPCVRFPEIYSCPECHVLAPHDELADTTGNRCGMCNRTLVSSRFVVVCSRGHIDDFPYYEWVHKDVPLVEGVEHELSIRSTGTTSSLADIEVKCTCHSSARRTLDGAFNMNAMRGIRRCTGRRPWLQDRQRCDELPRTQQRGASNVYFPVVESAISIPPWSDGPMKVINRYWEMLGNLPNELLQPVISHANITEGTHYTVEQLLDAAVRRKSGETLSWSPWSLKEQEFEALHSGRDEEAVDQDFVCTPASGADHRVQEWFSTVMSVSRLREVRALTHFRRLEPPTPSDPEEVKARLSRSPMTWLPAIEVNGEGVFLEIDKQKLIEWETRSNVIQRADQVDKNYRSRFEERAKPVDKVVTPRLLLIHTLAHALVNQWALDCGYPAGSLRERIYVGQPGTSVDMAGLMIYTSTSDSAGSLGGITALADSNRLMETLVECISRCSWCSSDPLCIEATAAGTDSLNLAACHACVLLPEVSCENMNTLLDRAMLIGTPSDPTIGFFVGLTAN